MYVILRLVESTGDLFFLYGGIFITVVVLFMMVLAPLVIMPLFNKYEAIEDNDLKKEIVGLADDINYNSSKIEIIDGSQRSSHSNAFQYGFGGFKKICIFDTLLKDMLGLTEQAKEEARKEMEEEEGNTKANEGDESEGEKKEKTDEDLKKKKYQQSDFEYSNVEGRNQILSVVAHELGHWSNMDVFKFMVSDMVKVYFNFFLFIFCLKYTNIAADFGFNAEPKSVYLSFILFFMVLSPILYLFNIQAVFMVRNAEFAADRFSVEQGYGYDLKEGLIKIFIKNQGNLNPDWLYSYLKHTHPPLIQRIEAIDKYIAEFSNRESTDDPIDDPEKIKEIYHNIFKALFHKRHVGREEAEAEGGCIESPNWLGY